MRKQKKSEVKKFVAGVTKYLLDKGAIRMPNELEDRAVFKFESKAGGQTITFDTEEQTIWTVYTRFENPTLAKELFDIHNGYSGKHNIHLLETLTSEEAIDEVVKFLNHIY